MSSTQKHSEATTPPPAIYNRIAVLRAERNVSRQSLADAVGVNYQTVGYIERGDYSPSLDLAMKFSEFFSVPLEMIFSRRPFTPLSTAVLQLSNRNPEKTHG